MWTNTDSWLQLLQWNLIIVYLINQNVWNLSSIRRFVQLWTKPINTYDEDDTIPEDIYQYKFNSRKAFKKKQKKTQENIEKEKKKRTEKKKTKKNEESKWSPEFDHVPDQSGVTIAVTWLGRRIRFAGGNAITLLGPVH